MAALVQGSHLKGVSMASMWNSQPKKVMAPDGSGMCETADDGFTLKGIDFTHTPGVPGAQIHSSTALTEATGSRLIFEALEDPIVTDTAPPTRQEVLRQLAAEDLQDKANRAPANPSKASLQELAALSELSVAPLAFRN